MEQSFPRNIALVMVQITLLFALLLFPASVISSRETVFISAPEEGVSTQEKMEVLRDLDAGDYTTVTPSLEGRMLQWMFSKKNEPKYQKETLNQSRKLQKAYSRQISADKKSRTPVAEMYANRGSDDLSAAMKKSGKSGGGNTGFFSFSKLKKGSKS